MTGDRDERDAGLERERQRLLDALYRERFGPSAHAPRLHPSHHPVETPTLGTARNTPYREKDR